MYHSRSKIVFMVHVTSMTLQHLIFCLPVLILRISIYKVRRTMTKKYWHISTCSQCRGTSICMRFSLLQRMKYCQVSGMNSKYECTIHFEDFLSQDQHAPHIWSNLFWNRHPMFADYFCIPILQTRSYLVKSLECTFEEYFRE